jgi:hypothetical protein
MHEAELPAVTRRIFLSNALQALGAAAALPLVAAAHGGMETAAAEQSAAPPLKVLSPVEYAVLQAVAETMIPQGGAFEMGARDVDLARRIDSYLPRLQPPLVTGFRGALVFTEQQAPGLAGKKGAFTSLSETDRAAVLSAMLAAGGLPASVFLGLKSACTTYFYTLDATWKHTGYDGPMLLEDRK